MKTLVSNLPGPTTQAPPQFTAQTEYPAPDTTQPPMMDGPSYEPPPDSVAGDIDAERRASELEFDSFSGGVQMQVNETYAPPPDTVIPVVQDMPEEETVSEDLRVGGLASPAAPAVKKQSTSDASIESPLNSMSIKELRRMADANGIPGAAELRKKELITALRNKVSTIINTGEPVAAPQVLSFDDIDAPNSD